MKKILSSEIDRKMVDSCVEMNIHGLKIDEILDSLTY